MADHIATGQKVAIKTLTYSDMVAKGVDKTYEKEIWIQQKLSHPHILRIFETIRDDKFIHIVMEFASGGELFGLINQGRLREDLARSYFQQLISALEHCHNRQIVHRDLKPENLLLDEAKQIKVADFGLATQMQDGKFLRRDCGSANYASIEQLSRK